MKRMRVSIVSAVFCFLLILLPLPSAFSTNSTWNGGTGNWSVKTNWTPAQVPNGSGYNVLIDGGKTGTNSLVYLDMNATIGNLTIDINDQLTINNGRTLTMGLANGTIANNGTILLNASSSSTALKIRGDVTLTGTGTLIMSNSSYNSIYGSSGLYRLTNAAGHTIQGSGSLGSNSMLLTNYGTITANQSTPLVIDPISSGVTNNGTMQAISGGTLCLKYGNFNNAGGLIKTDGSTLQVWASTVTGGNVEILGSGVIELISGTITGGVLTNSPTGIIRSKDGINRIGGTFNNVAGGQLIIDNSSTLELEGGTYTNNGTILLNGSSFVDDDTILRIHSSGKGTLANSGTIFGTGMIKGSVSNLGTISPGISTGILTITGNYIQLPDGLLSIELLSVTEYDKLHIKGSAVLDGTLRISLLSGFDPYPGSIFRILYAEKGVQGQFSSFDLPLLDGKGWEVIYGANAVDVRVTPAPSTLLLLGTGLFGVLGVASRKFYINKTKN